MKSVPQNNRRKSNNLSEKHTATASEKKQRPTLSSLSDLLVNEKRSWKSEKFRLMENKRLIPDLD